MKNKDKRKNNKKTLKIMAVGALAATMVGVSTVLSSCKVIVSNNEYPSFDVDSNKLINSEPNNNRLFIIKGSNIDKMDISQFLIKYNNEEIKYQILNQTSNELKVKILNFIPTTKLLVEYKLKCFYNNQEIATLNYQFNKEDPKPSFDVMGKIYPNQNTHSQFRLTGKNLIEIIESDIVVKHNNQIVDAQIVSTNNNYIDIQIYDTFSIDVDLTCNYQNKKIATLVYKTQEPLFDNKEYSAIENNSNKFVLTGTNLNKVKTNEFKIKNKNNSFINHTITKSNNQLIVEIQEEIELSQSLICLYKNKQVAILNYIAPEKLPIFNDKNQVINHEPTNHNQFKIIGKNLLKINKSDLKIKCDKNLVDFNITELDDNYLIIEITNSLSFNKDLICEYKAEKIATLVYKTQEPIFTGNNNVSSPLEMKDIFMLKGTNLNKVDTNYFNVKDSQQKNIRFDIIESSNNVMTLKILDLPEESQILTCFYKSIQVATLNYIAPEKLPIFNPEHLETPITSDSDNRSKFVLTGTNLNKVEEKLFKVKYDQQEITYTIESILENQLIIQLTTIIEKDAILNCEYDGSIVAKLSYKAEIVEPPKPEQPRPPLPDEWPQDRPPYTPHISQNLPRINLNVEDINGLNSSKTYKPFTAQLVDENGANGETIEGQIKVRGNSTSSYPKKPYRIKLKEKHSMFNMNNNAKAKNWVLLADWMDVSMLRNASALYLSQYLYREIGLYASDFRFVDIYMNDEYYGMYLLAEQNEVCKDRVNINKPEKGYEGTDIGYLLEMDGYANISEDALHQMWVNYSSPLTNWDNKNPMDLTIGEPNRYAIKSDINNDTQRVFIRTYLENVYKICYEAIVNNKYYSFNEQNDAIVLNPNLKDARDAIERVINIDSIVSTIILQEMVCDYDVPNSSFYMSVDLSPTGDGKVHFNVPWDFDNALGNRKMINDYGFEPSNKLYAVNTKNLWLSLFYKSNFVRNDIKDRWQQLKEQNIFNKIASYIDEVSDKYQNQFKSNYDKWKNIGPYIKQYWYDKSEYVVFHSMFEQSAADCNSQKDAANYLKQWWNHRFKVLDAVWSRNVSKSAITSVITKNTECEISEVIDNRVEAKFNSTNNYFDIELSTDINNIYDQQTINTLGFTSNARVSWESTDFNFSKQGNIFKSNNNGIKYSTTFLGKITEDNKETKYISLTITFNQTTKELLNIVNVVVNSPRNKEDNK